MKTASICIRGIAARQFQRSFVLAEGIEVSGAWLDNGLLHIDLMRPPVETRVRTIEIKDGAGTADPIELKRTTPTLVRSSK
jgi:HSP20 family molecular chaperone IbpA